MIQFICTLQDTLYILKQKQMVQLGKMKVSKKFYNEIIKETKNELKEINQDFMINWEENK